MEVDVDQVRHYPGGRWLDVDKRVVELALSPVASLELTLPSFTAAERRALKTPMTITAYTERTKATAEAILGVPGTLSISRISPDR